LVDGYAADAVAASMRDELGTVSTQAVYDDSRPGVPDPGAG